LRIIAGTAKGRKLIPPPAGSGAIRPTADRAREALFNIIGSRIRSARVLDLFCGTGAVGLEALSRGASFAFFVDNSAAAVALVRRNIALCGFEDNALVLKRDLDRGLSFLKDVQPCPAFDFVFLDPPYGKGVSGKIIARLVTEGLLASGAFVVVEERSGIELPASPGELALVDRRRYGEGSFWFYCQNDNEKV